MEAVEYLAAIYETEYAIFTYLITGFVAIVGLLTTIKCSYEFVLWLNLFSTENPEQVDTSKRTAIKAFAGVTLLSLMWVNGRKVYTDYINSKKVIHVSESSKLIAHKRSGTIHLSGISKGALPSKKWATQKIDLIRYRPYRGAELRIYEAIANEASKQRNDEVIISAYLLAIKSSPLSYHLYDKLTRVYGRRKEYKNILQLHESALNSLASMGLSRKSLKRATNEFAMRVNRSKQRALLC